MTKRNMLHGAAAALLFSCCGQAGAELADNADYRNDFEAWNAALLTAFPSSLLPGPFGTAADLVVVASDLRLKHLPATLVAPDLDPVAPNSQDGCTFVADFSHDQGKFDDLLGLFEIKSLPADWGFFGAPVTDHRNTGVSVDLQSPILDFVQAVEPPPEEGPRFEFRLPSGRYPMTWRARTEREFFFDVLIPSVLFVVTAELKYGKAITSTTPRSAARARAIGFEFLGSLAVEAGLLSAERLVDLLLDPEPDYTAEHIQERALLVYDVQPPTIETTLPFAGPFEAEDLGGLRSERVRDALFATIRAGDPCDRPVLTGNDIPVLFPLGTTTVTWEVRDTGPLKPGGSNAGRATVTQEVTIEDTRPPILLAPPHRIVEADEAPSPQDLLLGNAVAFDLADPDVHIGSDAPIAFPVDARTAVTWFAEDSGSNRDEKTQWVTVKTPGSNTAPIVDDATAATVLGETVDIELTGSDADFLSGRFDPLNFEILVPPANGFFVAPLLPYFIEDYRVRPGTVVGDIINNAENVSSALYSAFCDQGDEVPVDFVKDPEYVAVRDDGTSFVLDEYYDCDRGNTSVVTFRRLSKWSAEGAFLDFVDFGNNNSISRFTIDRDGFLYTVSPETSQNKLALRKFDPDTLADVGLLRLDPPTGFGQPAGRLRYARLDSELGVIYATDRERLVAYDATRGGELPAWIGAFQDGQRFLTPVTVAGSSNRGYHVEVDSEGFVYVADSGGHRIYQFAPAVRTSSGVELGELVGWLGRCDSGPSCDDENGRSFGYSCTDATCTVAERAGAGPGQFNRPSGLAIDGDDTLYVTDYENSRVQRFTPLGDFAGEAGSTCDGRCFVLGDMGRPLDISVNDEQFFVLDRERSLMHVFETAPFRDITENSVVVRYGADSGFLGDDAFTFRASDGLADSNVGTATIEVARNFRPPTAHDQRVDALEDTPKTITLTGSDPDGILGVDFNGLDTLRFEIETPPAHGVLSGLPPAVTYTPDPDFDGEDGFTFRVSDGVFDSDVARVALTVIAVNDAPVARFTAEESKLLSEAFRKALAGKAVGIDLEAGLGYPVPLFGEYDDPDAGEVHFAQIAWGDGTIQSTGTEFPPPKGNGGEPVMTPAFGLTGQVVAEHVYLAPGPKDVELCVFDRIGSGACIQTQLVVVPMVDLVIDDQTDRDGPADAGGPVSLALAVINAPPDEAVSAQPASGTRFTATVPADATLVDVEIDRGVCTVLDDVIDCELGTLSGGEAVAIDLHFLSTPDFDADSNPVAVDVIANERDATMSNATRLTLPVRTQFVFGDGFEG